MSPEEAKKDVPLALTRNILVGRPLFFKKAAAPGSPAADAPAKTPVAKTPLKKKFNAAAKKPKPVRQARYDAQGTTAIYRAASKGDMGTLKRLINAGYDPGQPCLEDATETPLMAAGRNCHMQALRALIDAGAKVKEEEIEIAIGFTIGHCKREAPQDRVDMALIDGWLAQGGNGADLSPFMHSAALANDLPLIKRLSGACADINHRCEWSRPYSLEKGQFTPVMCAIGGQGDNIECVSGMLTLGASAQDAYDYARSRRSPGDDPFEATPMGALLTEATQTGKLLTKDEARAAAHENLVTDMLQHPPPGLKYSGRQITRGAVEAHIRRYGR